MGRFNRGLLFAGIIGAVAGMYAMNMFDGTRTQRRIRYRGRNLMHSANRQLSRLGHVYAAGKAAIHEGMSMLRD